MIRTATHRRIMRIVVLVLVGLMVEPFAEADDYTFLHDGPALPMRAAASVSASLLLDSTTDDGTESQPACSCSMCMMALGESFSPEVFTPRTGEFLDTLSVFIHSSSHLPKVYRPPIA